jgi:hypothetical protein
MAGCGTQPAQDSLPGGGVDAGSIDETGDDGQDLPVNPVDDTPKPPPLTDDDTITEPAPGDAIDNEGLEPIPDQTQVPEEEEEIEPPVVLGPDDLLGAWKVESGAASVSNFQPERGFTTTHVEFSSNGVAMLFSKSSFGGTIVNLPATFDVVENELLVDSETDAFDGLVLKLEMPNDDELATTNALGEVAQFSRVDAVPTEARTGPLFVIKTHRFASSPHEATGLASFDNKLWATLENQNTLTFNLGTAEFKTQSPSPSAFKFIQAEAQSFLFLNCACDEQASALGAVVPVGISLSSVGTVQFDPTAEKNASITAAAYEPPTQLLWASSESNLMLSLSLAGLVVSDFRFQTLEGLASDGTSLWGLDRLGRVLVKIDPVGGQAMQSRSLPDRNVDWYDVEWAGDKLFIIGKDTTTTQAVLMEVTLVFSLGTGGGLGGGGIGGVSER